MKLKKLLTATAVCIAAIIFVTGCGQPQQGAPASKSPENYIMATGGTAGTYYPFGGAMCQIFQEKVEYVNMTAQSTGASVENCKLVDKNEAEFAIVQNDMLDYAYNGTEAFAEEGKLENLRVIASLYPEVVQLVATEDSGIKGIMDLKGKKVSVGAPGSGVEANVRQIFEVAGLTYDDMNVSFLSFAESADGLKDKHLDAAFVVAGVPNAAIQDVAAQNKITLVTIESDIADKLIAAYPFYSKETIPSGTYNNQGDAAETVAIKAVLAVNKDIPEDTVYDITKALFDNQAELAVAHAKGAEVTLDTALDGISIPFHPGAEKYFKEVGKK